LVEEQINFYKHVAPIGAAGQIFNTGGAEYAIGRWPTV